MRALRTFYVAVVVAALAQAFVAPVRSSLHQLHLSKQPSSFSAATIAATAAKDPFAARSQVTYAIFKRPTAQAASASKTRAAVTAAAASKPIVHKAIAALGSAMAWGKVLWQFARPHTMVGTMAAAVAVPLLATSSAARQNTELAYTILHGLVPGLLTNVFITGLNQVTDVEIDKINKPYLPVASGQLSKNSAAAISVAALVGALAMAFGRSKYTTTPLKLTVVLPALLGILYSLPPFRLKNHSLLAMLAILAVRGPIVNMGYYAHTKSVMDGYKVTSLSKFLKDYPTVLPLTAFYTIFGAIIALTKDIPDIKGDQMHKVLSYSVKLGPHKMFETTTTSLATMLSIVASTLIGSTNLAAPMSRTDQLRRLGLGILAALTASDVNARRHRVDPENPAQVYGFYMHLWKLFQASYAFLPLLSTA